MKNLAYIALNGLLKLFPILVFIACPQAMAEAPFQVNSQENHQLQVINQGVAALQKRLEMISRAQSFIDIEYFIYNPDKAGRIFTQALVQKKQQNPAIKIRLLLDASPITMKMKKHFIAEIENAGIEVRYYNPAALLNVFKTQYRSHRKLLLVDTDTGLEAITGGRNIADEYFDMSPRFNFLDRDVWVQGPVTESMRQSFEEFWASKDSKSKNNHLPEPVRNSSQDDQQYQMALDEYHNNLKSAADFLVENDHDRDVKSKISQSARALLDDENSMGVCNNVTYVADMPGFKILNNKASANRLVAKSLMQRISQIPDGGKLTAESPYFIIQDNSPKDELRLLNTKRVSATLLTNSLGSTDAFYVAGNFIPRAKFYMDVSDAKMFVYSGYEPNPSTWIPDAEVSAASKKPIWGIHAKTYVMGTDSFAIGTFNLDPRSANLNSEMLIFCDGNPRLTGFVLENIDQRINASRKLNSYGTKAGDKDVLYGASFLKKLEFLLSVIPATVFESLM